MLSKNQEDTRVKPIKNAEPAYDSKQGQIRLLLGQPRSQYLKTSDAHKWMHSRRISD